MANFKKYILSIINSIIFIYICIIILIVFLGGTFIKLYGNTCGISFLEPSTYVTSFILMGSPFCKTLNYLCYASSCLLENIWIHFGTICIAKILYYIPESFKNKEIIRKEPEFINKIPEFIYENPEFIKRDNEIIKTIKKPLHNFKFPRY